ncbi:hypothetical protein [Clostridium tunisiense]|uniref:hypothetical protein n=1 Tax=Clostridium tunisiense TaxID=219748 RepID=UPI0002DEF6B6|nr:hypothetical protein [Clostridium tunisiense]
MLDEIKLKEVSSVIYDYCMLVYFEPYNCIVFNMHIDDFCEDTYLTGIAYVEFTTCDFGKKQSSILILDFSLNNEDSNLNNINVIDII